MQKKPIEVALPLDVINNASAYDKMPGIGPHPKGIHHCGARLPLPCARAILFASLVDDPSSEPAFALAAVSAQVRERGSRYRVLSSNWHSAARSSISSSLRRHDAADGTLPQSGPAVAHPVPAGIAQLLTILSPSNMSSQSSVAAPPGFGIGSKI